MKTSNLLAQDGFILKRVCSIALLGTYMRVFGKGPKEFSDGSIPVQQFLKFETPSKSFKQIHVKNFSHNVDAFILDAVAFKSRT